MKKSENTKNLIIEVSLKLFSNNGYEAVSIRDIAKEANISLGLMYNYFDKKETLLKSIYTLANSQIIKSFEIAESANPLFDFENYINNVFEIITNNKDIWKFIHNIRVSENVKLILKNEIKETDLYIQEKLNYYISRLNLKISPLIVFAMIDGVVAHFLILEDYPIEILKKEIITIIKGLYEKL